MVRDLHDGAQQRFVHTVLTLKQARLALQHDADDAAVLVSQALDQAERATTELRGSRTASSQGPLMNRSIR